MILLIHGFNVTEEAAFTGYKAFLEKLGDPWVELATAVYWPGDSLMKDPDRREGWTYWLTLLPSYFWQPKRARLIGVAMADRLAQAVENRRRIALMKAELSAGARGATAPDPRDVRPPVLTIHIIAHSMGCRLTLELLHHLKETMKLPGQVDASNRPVEKPVQVKLVLMMAAAVPNYLVGEGGERDKAFKYPEEMRVRWSTRDAVLLGAFPIGQIFEGDEPHLPFSGKRSALGRSGPPSGQPLDNERQGHGKYWTSASIPKAVARDLAALHPERVAGPRFVPVAPLERPGPGARAQFERGLSYRELQAV